jgi:gluconokinase
MSGCYIVMGVSGAGKSLIGAKLAAALGCAFYDADDFHPEANLAKLRESIPLTDEDRYPWFQRLIDEVITPSATLKCVLACSALKRSYRDLLRGAGVPVTFIYLQGDYETIHARMKARTHFMREAMLQSQFATLEPPTPDEKVITVSILDRPEDMVAQIMAQLARKV